MSEIRTAHKINIQQKEFNWNLSISTFRKLMSEYINSGKNPTLQVCHVPLPAWPFLSPSWPQCPSAIAASPFSRLRSQHAPLHSELESSCHIPLTPVSDGIASAPVLGFAPADVLHRCKMH